MTRLTGRGTQRLSFFGGLLLSCLLLGATLPAVSAQEFKGNDQTGDIRGTAVAVDPAPQSALSTLDYLWPGSGCTTRADISVRWHVRDVTPDSVHVDRIEVAYRPNTARGFFYGYRLLSGDEDFQTENLILPVPEERQQPLQHVVLVDQTIPWASARQPPTVTFRPTFDAEFMPENAVGPCGNEVAILFELVLEPATRLAGIERVTTSTAVSQDVWGDGSARTVTLASSESFPDALAGSPSAVQAGGPLLLTPGAALADVTLVEIQRVLQPTGVVRVLGGDAAVSMAVTDRLAQAGYDVVRLAGSNRYETAARIAEATVTAPQLIYIADGDEFAFAMISGAAAAVDETAVVLTSGGNLPTETAAYLGQHPQAELIAVGRAAADAVSGARAIVGADQYETSALLAREISGTTLGVASGEAFPDGLSGGTHIGALGGPLLLSTPERMPASVRSYVEGTKDQEAVIIYGGTVALQPNVAMDAAGLGFLVDG